MTTDTIRYIPLDQLRLSPKNARRQRTPEQIDQLAASITAHGLLQNLAVEPSANDDGMFEVVAGGTRLAALEQLAREKSIGNVPVPCRVITNGETVEASAAENLIRTRLAPADEFDAFKAMADGGKSRAEIAQHFGVPEIVVSRSLKLANVDPQLIQIFRDGGMALEQLQALAITDNHEDQRKAWFGPKYDYERLAHHIRDRLTGRDVEGNSAVARFVGLDAYEAAGGAVRRDLFGKDVWLTDRVLLESLAMDRLEAIAQGLRDDGWSWVEAHLSLDYNQLNEYPRGFSAEIATESPLTAEQAARIEAIDKRLIEIEDEADEGVDEETEEKLVDEQDALESEAAGIRATQRAIWPAEAMAQSGCLVTLDDYHGRPTTYWARLRPGQKVSTDGAVTGTAKPTQAEKAAKAKDKPKLPKLSGDMQERLHLHHRAAVRLAVAHDADRAIGLLLAQLLGELFANSGGALLGIRVTNHHRDDLEGKAVKFADVKASPTRKALDAEIAELKKVLPKKTSEIQAWVGTRTVDQLHNLLALVAAVTLDPSKASAPALAAAAKIDMADHWQPDAEHYLSHVPKALAIDAVREIHGKDAVAKLAPMKAGAVTAEAGKLLAGTRWLPKPLRCDGYKTAKPGKAKAEAQAKPAAKKAAAKKATKNPAKAAKKAPAKKAPAKKAAES